MGPNYYTPSDVDGISTMMIFHIMFLSLRIKQYVSFTLKSLLLYYIILLCMQSNQIKYGLVIVLQP